jgi:hypothetical protein
MSKTLSYLPEIALTYQNNQTHRTKATLGRIALLAISCAGIFLGEYRLLVNGLIALLLSFIFIGISRILYTASARYLPDTVSDQKRIDTLACGVGIAISAVSIWILRWESSSGAAETVHFSYIIVLLVNMLSTSVAVVLGRSVLFPVYLTDHTKSDRTRTAPNLLDIIVMVTFAGIVGLLSTLGLRRAYISNVQVITFVVALMCVGGKSVLEEVKSWRRDSQKGYTAVSAPEDVESDNAGTRMSEGSEWSGETRVSGAYQSCQGTPYQSLSAALVVASIWVIFMILNFSDRLYPAIPKPAPILDLNYTPTLNQEIVISMYKEPGDHVRSLITRVRAMHGLFEAQVHIYIKDQDADLEEVRQATWANHVTKIPNVGREGEAYLYHIINNWDTLARQTFFLQADVHNPREFYPRIRDYFDPVRTGMLSLGWSGNVCNCQECGDKWDMQDPTGLFPTLHNRVDDSTQCENVLLSYKGQFVVSAKRIRGVDKSVYQDLHEAFVDSESWAHQEPYLRGRPDSMNAPQFGYQMERMWNLLFQCSDMDVAFRCPSLVSGAGLGPGRFGGSKEDCQCFDPVP